MPSVSEERTIALAEGTESPKTIAPQPESPNEDPPSDSEKSSSGRLRRLAFAALALVIVGAVIWFGHQWWTVGRFVESTDDAYVKADIATYSAQVPGTIVEIAAADNTDVKAGDVLLRIDDTRARTSLQEAKAKVASATAAIEATDKQIALQASNIGAAQADLASAKAQRDVAHTNAQRSQELLTRGTTPQASTDQ